MKAIKNLTNLFLSLCLAVTVTSCLNSDDDYSGQLSAADVATVAAYSGNNVSFTIPGSNNTTITLYSDQAAKIDAAAYPVGTRAYITYNYEAGQNLSAPVKIDLMSIAPVTTIPLTSTATPPALTYNPIGVNTMYCTGGYINLVVTTRQATDRTWTCYFDTTTSSGNAANVYLATDADQETAMSVNTVLSINVAQIVNSGLYKFINFHVLSQSGQNEFTINL